MYFFLFVALIVLTAGIILLLHRYQLKNRSDTIDRTAPLGAVDLVFASEAAKTPEPSPVLVPAPVAASTVPEIDIPELNVTGLNTTEEPQDTWLDQVKRLREEMQLDAALALCRENFPRIQAFQQTGIILRQQVRDLIEEHKPVTSQLLQLYRIAVFADLYRNSNKCKPNNPEQTLQALQALNFDYQNIGTRQLKLLTKSDIRHLEQLWGRPQSHQHAEDSLGSQWQALCA